MNNVKSITACAWLLAGCAGAPPSAVAPGAAAPSAAGPAPAAQRVQIPTESLESARRLGYKPRMSGGNLVYCKSVSSVGSHMPELTCIDEAHFDLLVRAQQQGEDNTRNTLERLQRTTACAAGNPNC